MVGNCCDAQAAKMADPSSTLSSLSGIKTGKPVHYTQQTMQILVNPRTLCVT